MQASMVCPKCRIQIPLDDVNVATDVALCRRCGQAWKYSELLDTGEISAVDLRSPPKGAWFQEIPPNQFEVGTTTRSAAAFFLVPFMCVWSGFSLGGIYGTQIFKAHFNLTQSLFGIPFILGTLLFGSFAVMTVCGKIVVRVEGDKGEVFTGVGPIGWRRRFSWNGVSKIRRTESRGENSSSQRITFEGENTINFATGIKAERLDFMLKALQKKWSESSHRARLTV